MDHFRTHKLPAIKGPSAKRRIEPFPYPGLPTVSATGKSLANELLKALPAQEKENAFHTLGSWLSEYLTLEDGQAPWTITPHLVSPVPVDLTAAQLAQCFATTISLSAASGDAVIVVDPLLARTWLTHLVRGYHRRRSLPRLRAGQFEGGLITSVILGACQQLASIGYAPAIVSPSQADRVFLEAWLQRHRAALIEATFWLDGPDAHGRPVRGWVRLLMPASFSRHLIDASEADHSFTRFREPPFRDLTLRSKIVLCAVSLPARDALRLRRGDLLLPASHGLRAADIREPEGFSTLDFGRNNQIHCLIRPDNGMWQLEITRIASNSTNKDGNMRDEDRDNSDDATMAMASMVDMKVEVHIGSFQLSLGELANMRRGSIVELKTPVGRPVDLIVDGQLIGQGELVVIEGHLGVRILSIGKQKS